jgi:hypothetical protein
MYSACSKFIDAKQLGLFYDIKWNKDIALKTDRDCE